MPESSASRRGSLDRRAILAAALAWVDAEGLAALSMRKLGGLLGVEAMTLYYYFPNKAALVQGISEVALEQLEVPEAPAGDWRSAARQLARAFRDLGRRHPNVFPLLATVGLENPASYRPLEAMLELLQAAGFAPELAFTAFAAIKSYVVGETLWMLGDQVLGSGARALPADDVRLERFPAVARVLPYLASCDPDAEFERGLDVLLAGLEALSQ